MLDIGAGGGLHVVDDTDPSLSQEPEQGQVALLEDQIPQTKSSSISSVQSALHVQELINECDFFLSVHKTVPVKAGDWKCHIGSFSLHLNVIQGPMHLLKEVMPVCKEFWLYINMTTGSHLAYFEIDDTDENLVHTTSGQTILYFTCNSEFPVRCLNALQVKGLYLVLLKYDLQTAAMEIGVFATEGVLTKLRFSSEGSRPKCSNLSLQLLMGHLYNLKPPGKVSRQLL